MSKSRPTREETPEEGPTVLEKEDGMKIQGETVKPDQSQEADADEKAQPLPDLNKYEPSQRPLHERSRGSNLPPYLRHLLDQPSQSSPSQKSSIIAPDSKDPMNEKSGSSPSIPDSPPQSRRSSLLPAYYDSQPSSQPPKYFDPSKPFSPTVPTRSLSSGATPTPRTFTPASAKAVNAVIAQPSAEWVEYDKKKRGWRERLREWKPERREDEYARWRHATGSGPVMNVWGVRVSDVKEREWRRKGPEWK